MLHVNSAGPQLLSISGDATVYEANTLYAALAGLSLAGEGQISIDLGSLESMDVSSRLAGLESNSDERVFA